MSDTSDTTPQRKSKSCPTQDISVQPFPKTLTLFLVDAVSGASCLHLATVSSTVSFSTGCHPRRLPDRTTGVPPDHLHFWRPPPLLRRCSTMSRASAESTTPVRVRSSSYQGQEPPPPSPWPHRRSTSRDHPRLPINSTETRSEPLPFSFLCFSPPRRQPPATK